MSLPVVLTPEAEAEFDEAADWYEENAGLGAEFTAAVHAVFDRIGNFPLIHQVVFKNIRRAVVKKFPYIVYYRPESDRISVIAVFHGRRNPTIWQGRA